MIKCCSKFRKLLALVRILKMNDKMNGIPYFGTFGDNFVTQVIQCYLFSPAVTHHFVIRLFSQSHISQNNNFFVVKKIEGYFTRVVYYSCDSEGQGPLSYQSKSYNISPTC